MDLILLIINLSMGLLFLFVTLLLNSAQPGGGCLFGITFTVSTWVLLVSVSTVGISTSTGSSYQSNLKHQHLLYFGLHSEQNSPMMLGLATSASAISPSVSERGTVLAHSGFVNNSGE